MRCHRWLFWLLIVGGVGGCTSTAPGGRTQLTAPAPLSSFYSSVDMNLQLVSANSVPIPCTGNQCRLDKAFDRQVERLGKRLARSAYEIDPELYERVPAFSFSVAEKSDMGSASDAAGNIVVFRGVRDKNLDEAALAYLVAREMAKVMARHHDERSATTILTTILAQALVPALSLAGGVAFLATTAASAAGTKAITSTSVDERAEEVDMLAIKLMARQGWTRSEVVISLKKYVRNLGTDGWSQELKNSVVWLSKRKDKESIALATTSAEDAKWELK